MTEPLTRMGTHQDLHPQPQLNATEPWASSFGCTGLSRFGSGLKCSSVLLLSEAVPFVSVVQAA